MENFEPMPETRRSGETVDTADGRIMKKLDESEIAAVTPYCRPIS